MPSIEQNETPEKLPDLSAYQQEKIRNFDELNMGSFSIAELMLIFLGYKPATEIDLAPWNVSPKKLLKIIKESELLASIKRKKDVNGKEFTVVAVAKDKDILEKLLKTEANKDHEEYGKLMGYPDTAIEAFVNKKKQLPIADYPDRSGIIFPLKLSKDHWQEEIKVVKKWSQVIKQYSPETYEFLMPFI